MPLQALTATEDWARATSDSILSVVELRERRTEEAAANERPPSVTTILKVKGWDLPTTASDLGNTVTFEDPLISFVEFVSSRPAESSANRPAELELKVRLQAGVRPGEKSIRVTNLDGSWTLRFRDSRPQVQFRRRTGPRQMPPQSPRPRSPNWLPSRRSRRRRGTRESA